MTDANYQKLSKEEQFNFNFRKQLLSYSYCNEDGERIDFQSTKKVIDQEFKKLGIDVHDKSFVDLHKALNSKNRKVFTQENLDCFGDEIEVVIMNRYFFLQKYLILLDMYINDFDFMKINKEFQEGNKSTFGYFASLLKQIF